MPEWLYRGMMEGQRLLSYSVMRKKVLKIDALNDQYLNSADNGINCNILMPVNARSEISVMVLCAMSAGLR